MKNSYQEGTAFPPHGQMPVGHVVGRGRASAQNEQTEICSVRREKSLSATEQTPGHHKQHGEAYIPLPPPLMGLHKYLTWV